MINNRMEIMIVKLTILKKEVFLMILIFESFLLVFHS